MDRLFHPVLGRCQIRRDRKKTPRKMFVPVVDVKYLLKVLKRLLDPAGGVDESGLLSPTVEV